MMKKHLRPIKKWIKKCIKTAWKYLPLPHEQKAILKYKCSQSLVVRYLCRDKSEEMRRELISQYERYKRNMGEETGYQIRLDELRHKYRKIIVLRPYIMNIGPLCMQYMYIYERMKKTANDEKLIVFNYDQNDPIYRLDNPKVSNRFIMNKMMELVDFIDESDAAFWGYAVLHSDKFIFFEDLYRGCVDIHKKEKTFHEGKGQYPSTVYMKFSKTEHQKGTKSLSEMNLTPRQYCCFFSRSNEYHESYFNNHGTETAQLTSKRNSDITDYYQACTELAKSGVKAVRVGAIDSRKVTHENVVDYTNICRSEFMDFYLMGHAKFFLGDTSGILYIPWLFNVPLGLVNNFSIAWGADIENNYNTEGSMTILKKWWDKKKERYLSLREMLKFVGDFGVADERELKLLDELGISFHSNTAEEIADLAIEMNMRADGTWKDDAEVVRLRRLYWDMVNDMVQKASPIITLWDLEPGSMFLKKNQWLFG